MRHEIMTLSLAGALALTTSNALASLGTPRLNKINTELVMCPYRDFNVLHQRVARFLEREIAPSYSDEALQRRTDELPGLLKRYFFYRQASLLQKEIAYMDANCILVQK